MVKNGYLTQVQATAQKFPKLLSDKSSGASSAGVNANSSDPWAPYILTQVEDELTSNDGLTQQQLADRWLQGRDDDQPLDGKGDVRGGQETP